MRLYLVVIVCLLLGGCVSADANRPNVVPSSFASDHAKVLAFSKLIPDPHKDQTEAVGPIVLHDNDFHGKLYLLRAFTDPKHEKIDNSFMIEVAAHFPKRVYLGDVYSQGSKMSSRVMDRERLDCGIDCTTKETVGIFLTEGEIAGYAERGLMFEIVGRRKSIVMTIPKEYFAAVLEFHRSHRAAGS